MKKNLLLAALVIPLLSVSAQWTQTGGTVTVQPNTLHYMSGSYEVNGGGQAINKGNVNVQGDFTIDETIPNTEFRNKFTSGTEYGQLILQDGSGQVVTGKIHNEFKLIDDFAYHSISVPFMNYSGSDLVTNAEMGNVQFLGFQTPAGTYDVNRWKNPVFHWDLNNYHFDTPADADILNPSEYYEVNNIQVQGGSLPNTNSITTYVGSPNNFSINNPFKSVVLQGYDIPANNQSNIFGGAYGSYIADPGSAMPVGWNTPRAGIPIENDFNGNGTDFGNNIYYLGNPYTSNIDLTDKLTNNPNFTHIVQFLGNSYVREDGNGELVESYTGFSLATTDGTGDINTGVNPFIVRPFHTYLIKMAGLDLGETTTIDFDDSIKTFEELYAPSFARVNNNSNLFYQVGMDLYNDQDVFTGNRFYVVASDTYGPAATNGIEAYNIYLGENTGFYTLQENADGTINSDLSHNPVYINGVNASDYVGKPIQLVFQSNRGGNFTLKPRLNSALLNSSNKFYFEDSLTGEFFEITEDFTYTFNANESDSERFKMYWNGVPETLNTSDITPVAKTLVYKNIDNAFQVRFAENWNKADIYVYNVMGQLVHSAKSLDTSIDYTLPLKGHTSAYIVKAVSEKGEVATQKIINK